MARMLVIDEALELRVALTRFLAALGHDVVAFESHAEVLALGQNLGIPERIDLAIVEVLAVDPRTLQLVAELKSAFPGVKIAVTTRPELAAARHGPALLSQALGVVMAIFKPFTAADLEAVVNRVLASHEPDSPKPRRQDP
jgi:response regulator RpfG family c-di-GMP phosphodiesterase